MPVKYTVALTGPARQMPSVVMPSPAIDGLAATRGHIARTITGHPGDMLVPSPKPGWTPAGPLVRSAQPSWNSPDYFMPSVYYNTIAGKSLAGVRWVSTNELPVPAIAVEAVPELAFTPVQVGGSQQARWPPAQQSWQSLNGVPS